MKCTLCPRECEADRSNSVGYCLSGDKIKIAKVMIHNWEEPCVSGSRGSGAIFFSGCPLKCEYCQNKEISHGGVGQEITTERFAALMLELQDRGVHNINLVSPTQYADKIRDAIDLIRPKLKIPVVYNTGGYELISEIEKMSGYVDVFLTDMKYYSSELSNKYSKAPDYYEKAIEAFKAMLKIAPECIFDDDRIIKKGIILRHLILPSCRKDSIKILENVAEICDVSNIRLSLMSQYTPDFYEGEYTELKRRVTTFEYESVLKRAIELGYDGYLQERSSASSAFTPDFTKGEIYEIKNT
ncbi:MAG: radical SAM protein [Clostridia bacterium]|nr:radical SAM protein [Clostridia bacterium]